MKAHLGWQYGLMGLPLAFVALPLYVLLPAYYATHIGLSLGLLGAVLLGARVLDAIIDPYLGRLIDRWLHEASPSPKPFHHKMVVAMVCMAVGYTALWWPPFHDTPLITVWLCAALILTFIGFSLLSISHYAWGARWVGSASFRSRLVSWREGLGLIGVMLASVLPTLLGYAFLSCLLILSLGVAGFFWLRWPIPGYSRDSQDAHPQSDAFDDGNADVATPISAWHWPAFRRLITIFTVNGLASAIPATLLPFFVADRLGASPWLGGYLALYFLAAAVSLPFWNRALKSHSLTRIWAMGMVLSIISFIGVVFLKTGDLGWFALVCLATGMALGADLCAPAALLSGLLQKHIKNDRITAQCFGWWAFAQKLALALSAGLMLPLLQGLGYSVGNEAASTLWLLTMVYGLVPCLIKTLALALLLLSSPYFGEPS